MNHLQEGRETGPSVLGAWWYGQAAPPAEETHENSIATYCCHVRFWSYAQAQTGVPFFALVESSPGG